MPDMSYVTYHNVLKKEGADGKRMEMKYQNEEDVGTQAAFNTYIQTHQNTVSESTRKRSCRSVMVCLVVSCVLLLTAVIVLCVLIYTNNHLYNKTALWTINNKADEWTYYRSSFYYISSEKKSWTESRKFCRDRGADLIIINNKEEQDFFRREYGSESYWIGLSDSDKEGMWKWVDDSTPTTEFWKSGQPNGHRREDCAITYSEWWYDYPCTDDYKWICEKNIF